MARCLSSRSPLALVWNFSSVARARSRKDWLLSFSAPRDFLVARLLQLLHFLISGRQTLLQGSNLSRTVGVALFIIPLRLSTQKQPHDDCADNNAGKDHHYWNQTVHNFYSLSESVSEMKQRRRDGNRIGPQITQITPIKSRQTLVFSRSLRFELRNLRNLWISSTPEARDQALVDSARDTYIVQVVFANLGEPAGLIEIEDLAAFDFAGLARFNSQSPGNVVETDAVATAEPPPLHRIEHSPHVVFAQVDRRPGGDVIHQAALIDKRQVKTDNVVADDFIALQIKIGD